MSAEEAEDLVAQSHDFIVAEDFDDGTGENPPPKEPLQPQQQQKGSAKGATIAAAAAATAGRPPLKPV
eukprot:15469136-Alexandrium_andersonii.AAC.1